MISILILAQLAISQPTASPRDLALRASAAQSLENSIDLDSIYELRIDISAGLLWGMASGLMGEKALATHALARHKIDSLNIVLRNVSQSVIQQPSPADFELWKTYGTGNFSQNVAHLALKVNHPVLLPGSILSLAVVSGQLTGPPATQPLEFDIVSSSFPPSDSLSSDSKTLCDTWVAFAKNHPLPVTCVNAFSPPEKDAENEFDFEKRKHAADAFAKAARASKRPVLRDVGHATLDAYDFKKGGYSIAIPEVIGGSNSGDIKVITKPRRLFLKVPPAVAERELAESASEVFLVFTIESGRVYTPKEAMRLGYPRPYMFDASNEIHITSKRISVVTKDGRHLGELK